MLVVADPDGLFVSEPDVRVRAKPRVTIVSCALGQDLLLDELFDESIRRLGRGAVERLRLVHGIDGPQIWLVSRLRSLSA